MREAELIAGCKKGKRKAQRLLYEQYRTPMYRMCLRYARDRQEAEDFLHDGLLEVLRNIHKFRGEGALGAWVRRVVLNVALQQLRKRPSLVSSDQLPELEGGQTEDELDGELQHLSAAQIFALVRELPLGYRTVFNLYYVEELSHQEIADQLGISLGSSKSQLHKGRLALRKAISIAYPDYQYRSV